MKKRILAILMAVMFVASMMAGCGDSSSSSSAAGGDNSSGTDYSNLKIAAFFTNGTDDGGWGQAQYEGIVKAMESLNIPKDNLSCVTVAETGTDLTDAAEGLIADGVDIVIGVSTGYRTAIEALASAHPETQFMMASGTSMNGNLVGYQIRSYDGMFCMGYLSALMSETDELGYSAGQPEGSVIQGINAFALGAKYANPDATVRVVWANSWYDPTAEAECANSLISLGITSIGINASSPAIAQACEAAGVHCTGYHVDMKDYAPKAVMASYQWNWAPIFEAEFTEYVTNGLNDEYYYWGAEKGCSAISDINTDIVSQEIADKVTALYEQIASGEVVVLAGELKDNEGNVVVEEGAVMDDDVNKNMGFLVENVIGQLP